MKRKRLLIGVGVIAVVFGWLMFGGLRSNVVFFLTPQELLAKGNEALDVPVRLGGMVKAGSVQWDAQKLDLRFVVTDYAGEVAVRSTGAPPQMFRDSMGVIVEGRFGRDSVFQATGLMVKHSNEYRAPKPGEAPHEKYRTLIVPQAPTPTPTP